MRTFRIFGIFSACLLAACAAQARPHDFTAWLGGVRAEAQQAGISEKTIEIALNDNLRPVETIIKLDRKQPEGTKTLAQYLSDVVNKKRIQDGRARFADHKQALSEIGARYGVEPQFIVALWGIETNFGHHTGGFDVVTALATLAYDGRRSDFFRTELMAALRILDDGHIDYKDMKGSWAGAMGQVQFMPTSFYKFAQDYNKNGRTDIWNDRDDVFASAANYLAKSGWKRGEPWGRRVSLPDGFDERFLGIAQPHQLTFWHTRGVRTADGKPLPLEAGDTASIIRPDGPGTPAYIIYDNYHVIMKWNKSTYFATAVSLLADAVKG